MATRGKKPSKKIRDAYAVARNYVVTDGVIRRRACERAGIAESTYKKILEKERRAASDTASPSRLSPTSEDVTQDSVNDSTASAQGGEDRKAS